MFILISVIGFYMERRTLLLTKRIFWGSDFVTYKSPMNREHLTSRHMYGFHVYKLVNFWVAMRGIRIFVCMCKMLRPPSRGQP